jgi:hypothetical protein
MRLTALLLALIVPLTASFGAWGDNVCKAVQFYQSPKATSATEVCLGVAGHLSSSSGLCEAATSKSHGLCLAMTSLRVAPSVQCAYLVPANCYAGGGGYDQECERNSARWREVQEAKLFCYAAGYNCAVIKKNPAFCKRTCLAILQESCS